MRARSTVSRLLTELNTLDGVREAYEHMMDMMRLCRVDNLGLRRLLPSIMLRLDLDQECYDFIKWHATADQDGHYDWGDMDLPFLHIHDTDVLEEPVPVLKDKYSKFDHIVATLVLKLKLLADIRNLKVARKIFEHQKLVVDLHETIELSVIRSPLSARFTKLDNDALRRTETKLRKQIMKLGNRIMELNDVFTRMLFKPDEALSARPGYSSSGSREEAVIAIQQSYAVLWETEGVLELLNDTRECATRDADDDEIDQYLAMEGFWDYLDDAMQDASYLGPWPERPSVRFRYRNR
jgi:hypothetical protein